MQRQRGNIEYWKVTKNYDVLGSNFIMAFCVHVKCYVIFLRKWTWIYSHICKFQENYL